MAGGGEEEEAWLKLQLVVQYDDGGDGDGNNLGFSECLNLLKVASLTVDRRGCLIFLVSDIGMRRNLIIN